MAFPFPDIDRRIYKWTFLKDVSVGFEFKSSTLFVSQEGLNEMFSKLFSLENITESSLNAGLKLHDTSNRVELYFSLTNAKIKLRFPLYTSFDIMMKFFPVMERYFKAIGLDEVSRVYIEKYNELDYSLSQKEVGVIKVMEEIFSKNLLDDKFYSIAGDFDQLSRWERKLEFEGGTGNDEAVTIEYGFYKKDNEVSSGVLTMKTRSALSGRLDAHGLKNKLENLNNLIDRVFRWCVTNQIIEKMERGNE